AREVDRSRARVVIFDEPTAVLTESEAREMLRVMRELARGGLAILFITHRLDEIFEVASRITVLRDGEGVATLDPASTTPAHLAELMVGRPATGAAHSAGRSPRTHPGAPDRGGSGTGTADDVLPTGSASASAVAEAGTALSVRDLRVAMPGERV